MRSLPNLADDLLRAPYRLWRASLGGKVWRWWPHEDQRLTPFQPALQPFEAQAVPDWAALAWWFRELAEHAPTPRMRERTIAVAVMYGSRRGNEHPPQGDLTSIIRHAYSLWASFSAAPSSYGPDAHTDLSDPERLKNAWAETGAQAAETALNALQTSSLIGGGILLPLVIVAFLAYRGATK